MMKNKWIIVLCFLLVILAGILLLMAKRSLQKLPAEESMEKIKTVDEEKTEGGSGTNLNDEFSIFSNVTITGIDLSTLTDEELDVLYIQAKYCQAMTDVDIETMREIVPEDMTFTHMSGMQQTREEYFADIADGSLNYFTIGIENPVVKVDGDRATVSFTSVLNANDYGGQRNLSDERNTSLSEAGRCLARLKRMKGAETG